MADQKISELAAAGALVGDEVVPLVQSGATRKATVEAIAALGATVVTETGTNRDIASTDAGAYIRMTNAGAKTATFRPEATHALPANSEFHFRCAGGGLTLTPGSGVTLNAPAGGTLVLSAGMTVTVKRVSADVFDVIGQTVAA